MTQQTHRGAGGGLMRRAQAGEAEGVAAGAAHVERAAAAGRSRNAVGPADARVHRQTPPATGPWAPDQANSQIMYPLTA